MEVFELRDRLIDDYASYISSFIQIRDERIYNYVNQIMAEGLLWPDPLIQLNPSFMPGCWIDQLIDEGILHEEARRIFRIKSEKGGEGDRLRLYKHQEEAVRIAQTGKNYVLTTGTGSGKSLAYIIPIVDYVLRHGSGKGIKAIVVYPMNALANSQLGELEKFLCFGYPDGNVPVSFARYTGQETEVQKQEIRDNPPDILLTNYVMLELILTRPEDRKTLVKDAQGLRFLVLDELHTYRGRQGSDVAMLVRRVRNALNAHNLQYVGTSATIAGTGSLEDQQVQVAQVATQIFGADIRPESVIGETLRRATPEVNLRDPMFVSQLKLRISNQDIKPLLSYSEFINDPLSIWIESTFGVITEPESGRLIRAQPRSITGEEGAAKDLSLLTGISEVRCIRAIKECLLAGYKAEPDPETRFPVFAFRLHQFLSRGEAVYASLEREDQRYITVHGQQFVPGDRSRILLPLVFCQECGQEYYSVRMSYERETGFHAFTPRDFTERQEDEQGEPGFIYLSTTKPWPTDSDEQIRKLPDDWVEEHNGTIRVRPSRRPYLPSYLRISSDGREDTDGLECHFLSAPFRFCLNCGVSYDFRQQSDLGKLVALGAGGRSTATTILSISAIRTLRQQASLPEKARKLLSFTDNRQDASLQAGHFNDFVEVSLLRSALYQAVRDAGDAGITHEELTQKVFGALDVPVEAYASDPKVLFQAKIDTDRALRDVLGYRLYLDLRRGWRITSPNLEQCGLLEIQYASLNDVCHADEIWQGFHSALLQALPETRRAISKVLLDFMRRELAIKVDYLDSFYQEKIQQRSSQRLIPPWAIDEDEIMQHAKILYPRSAAEGDYGGNVYVSARGGFGQFLRRPATFPDYSSKLSLEETQIVIRQLLQALTRAGLVQAIVEPRDENEVPGYQLPASGLIWKAGDGQRGFHDPIRVPREAEGGSRTNPFFVQFYRTIAGELGDFEAREHTAQVPYDERIEREERFRTGELPILFCSPTMELGVDIAQLNVVNMRNVPPTPANYAQRSGRAGRSGQPALVFTYCSVGSPHDQYFFKRPENMVAGAVKPPRLDLSNEDLIRAHIHAIWLAETGLSLGTSLKDILDLSGEDPTLELLPSVQDAVRSDLARARAYNKATEVLKSIPDELNHTDWYRTDWLENDLDKVSERFEAACERWRSLYRAAFQQSNLQQKIILDAARNPTDKEQAKHLRREAESQLELLTDARSVLQSDFYSYRYFASEGFLPGYSFPRLPLSAYIPARRVKTAKDEFLSRPRFLAISEFGPRSIVYHEGSRYIINKVIMPVREAEQGAELMTHEVKQCPHCGYLHPFTSGMGPDLCERCKEPLDSALRPLFRLQNVSTKRRDRINSDEEERVRMGYELRSGVRFADYGGRLAAKTALIEVMDQPIAQITYGPTASLWRINLGWRRRSNQNQYGFVLDIERGVWESNKESADDPDDPMSPRTLRVIPYVEDRKNCLLFEPLVKLDKPTMASLTASIKSAIQVLYQLEDNELAAEPLPTIDERRLILLYEAAEGGAGVLRRIVEDPAAFPLIAREALRLCHFDPETGNDLHRAPRAREDCEAACYDCLMSYFNQMDHLLLDRHLIKEFLQQISNAIVSTSPVASSRSEHLQALLNLCQSDLEREWLLYMDRNGYRLPSHAQKLIVACHTRPDFLYQEEMVAVYVDGYHHFFEDRRERDRSQTECMEDIGYTVLRFGVLNDWDLNVSKYPNVFGALKQ
jgi:ATP-dependent helicase YprA (DUF1998 family)